MFAEDAIDFGAVTVGATQRRSITIRNPSATAVSVASLTTDDPQFQVIARPNATIAAGGELVVDLELTPIIAGAHAGRLSIGFDADPVPQLTVALTGVGVSGDGGAAAARPAAAAAIPAAAAAAAIPPREVVRPADPTARSCSWRQRCGSGREGAEGRRDGRAGHRWRQRQDA